MRVDQYHSVYFVGIGGIGMSALARWFKARGATVSGYDATPTLLTQSLIDEQIPVHFSERDPLVPHQPDTRDSTLVIYTPAIQADSALLNRLRQQGFTVIKRSEALGAVVARHKTIAVAGTHGKTTTSSLIAHILKCAGVNMEAFLGGVMVNYASNFITEGESTPQTVMVVEADEFDRSFLTLFPHIGVVTSMDPDHLDTYGHAEAMKDSFAQFARQIDGRGQLIAHQSVAGLAPSCAMHTYGLREGEFRAEQIRADRHTFSFDWVGGQERIADVSLPMPGFHNVENAVAAIAAARFMGVSPDAIVEALRSFRGIKRRLECVIELGDVVYIDDYAHHPVEIASLIASVKAMYPERCITAVFQPHLYSRTRDFAAEFAKSLSMADQVLVMDIYPARENPIAGISADLIFKDIVAPVRIRCSKSDLLQRLSELNLQTLLTVGAGDISEFAEPIKAWIGAKYANHGA